MKLTWTIKDAGIGYPEDDLLYQIAVGLPEHDWKNRPIYPVPGKPEFGIERFGNSCRVYTVAGMIDDPEHVLTDARMWKSVGLFTWGMSKAEAQQKYCS